MKIKKKCLHLSNKEDIQKLSGSIEMICTQMVISVDAKQS